MTTKFAELTKQQAKPETVEIARKVRRIREVLPEKLLTELTALGSFTNQIRWRLGDAVNRTAKILTETGRGGMLDACWFVALSTDDFRSQNTLHTYAQTAAFYSKRVRRLYQADNIPFSHFTYAKTLHGFYQPDPKKLAIPMWEVCLQFSVAWYEHYSWTTSERALREYFNAFQPVPVNNPATLAGQLFQAPVEVGPEQGILSVVDMNISVPAALTSLSYTDLPHVLQNVMTRALEIKAMLPVLVKMWSPDKWERIHDLTEKLLNELTGTFPANGDGTS